VITMAAGEFRTHCSKVIETVRRRREAIIITKRGVPVAKLVPVDLPKPHKVFGCLEGRCEEVGDIMSPVVPPEAWDVLK
jgi:prevent-host-death family protein